MIDSGKNLQRLSKIFAFTKTLFEVIIFYSERLCSRISLSFGQSFSGCIKSNRLEKGYAVKIRR